MQKRGRKRTSIKLPKHIDASKLPTGVWFNSSGQGRWVLEWFDQNGKRRHKKIAGNKATLSEIWQAFDANKKEHLPNCFKKISLEFQQSIEYKDLKISTRRDYEGCHQAICNSETSDGKRFGDIDINHWTVGTVRKYRDFRAEHSRSRANKELGYISRVLAWAYCYEKVKSNPAKGIPKLHINPRQHYASAKDYQFLLNVARESNYWYMPIAMEIAYLCRMRLSEVLDLTDANELENGLLIKRRKGSRDNIVEWNDQLKKLWQTAKATRNKILTDRKQPQRIEPDKRFIFISEFTGDRIQVSSLKTAKNRIDKQAEEKAQKLGIDYVHFTFHDLKRKGISDTIGDKQKASGHRNASMLNIYDVSIEVVKPAGEK